MIDLGLQRISRLMAESPMPWRAVHVAGTNGKGSVCAYLSEMLNAYNKSEWRLKHAKPAIHHGRFTSPFLVDPWDCISICTKENKMRPITSRMFYDLMGKVEQRNNQRAIQATDFELLTAVAFEAFTRAEVDVAVVEVGMGGRLDSTNIIGQPVFNEDGTQKDVGLEQFRPPPVVTAITKIGLDHQGFLGDTIEEIAREKAGIIKPGVPLVYDNSNEDSVCDILRQVAVAQNATPVVGAGDSAKPGIPQHQLQNYAVASKAALWTVGNVRQIDIAHPALAQELSEIFETARHTTFAGRQEQINIEKLTGLPSPKKHALIDGAHNAQSAEALADYLANRHKATSITTQPSTSLTPSRRPITWILAASDTKDITGIFRPLLRSGDRIFAVEFGPVQNMPWVQTMASSMIVNLAKEAVPGLAATRDYGRDILGAIKAAAACGQEEEEHDIVITGSLYLVGEVHRMMSKEEEDDDGNVSAEKEA